MFKVRLTARNHLAAWFKDTFKSDNWEGKDLEITLSGLRQELYLLTECENANYLH